MTINHAHKLVKALVGEDDFHDVKDILTSYYDIAQREIATTVCPIKKVRTVKAGEKILLPKDVYRLCKVSASYERTDTEHIIIEGSGVAQITYYAYPERLYDDTPGYTEFEVEAAAQSAIPYFAAAQVVLADSDMRRYYAFMDSYNSILANVDSARKSYATVKVVKTEEMQ